MTGFSSVFKEYSGFMEIKEAVKENRVPIGVIGTADIHKAFLINGLLEETGKRGAVLVHDEKTGLRMKEDLENFGTSSALMPSKDLSYISNQIKSREYEYERAGALSKWLSGEVRILIIPVEAALQKTVPQNIYEKRIFRIESDMDVEREAIIEILVSAGYSQAGQVDGKGQFSVRGGILDFFPPDRLSPVRVEFWGDTVDSVSEFDVYTQRRTDMLDYANVTPATEWIIENREAIAARLESQGKRLRSVKNSEAKEKILEDSDRVAGGRNLCLDKYINFVYENPVYPLSYLSEEDLLFVGESREIKNGADLIYKANKEGLKMALEDGDAVKGMGEAFGSFKELLSFYESCNTVYLDNFTRGSFDTALKELITVNPGTVSLWNGSLKNLKEDIFPENLEYYKVVLAAGTPKAAKALAEDLADDGYNALYYPVVPERFPDGQISVLGRSFSGGMKISETGFYLVTHSGMQKEKKRRKYKPGKNSFHSLDELHKGDYVVHSAHGIGVFSGIENLVVSGVSKDFIKLKYAKGDILYVPVTQLDLVSKYIGPGEDTRKVKLNRLGTQEWRNTRTRVRTAVADMAKELTALYAKRLNTKGYEFMPDTDLQSNFESRFEYTETDDQLQCINEIKHDMEQPHPMDRLLCGDVGFGKTEVALRAAFKCIVEGKQCAILVPTTILAFQHYNTILKRFQDFPVEIEMVSRFRSPKETKEILQKTKRGYVDILVGTHRIISKDVKFRDLGLLIVDEEQRFGVAQKEKLKQKFPNVDVLTLSATPIPRTLNMAMTGIRDMSLIEEAPSNRHPVQTYVLEHDINVIQQAIEKELRRGGQVYYMYNNIEGLIDRTSEMMKLMPNVRFGIAHGRMNEDELSSVWRQLVEGEIDVLMCTTIIETGVDVSNVNTLIIEGADRMGLAQLHQIRGRIGRSERRATAYLTFPGGKELTDIARRRLGAIREYTEFGSGFKIAMRDLELRGAGNILGAEQHGHMEAVGYDLYLKLLGEAIETEKTGKVKRSEPEEECLIDLNIAASIPDGYIENTAARLTMYRRIADIETDEDAMDVMDELIDRFGEPPKEVQGLIEISGIRNRAMKAGITEIKEKGDNLLLYWNKVNMRAAAELSGEMKGRVLVNAGNKPYISFKIKDRKKMIPDLKEGLEILYRGIKLSEETEESK